MDWGNNILESFTGGLFFPILKASCEEGKGQKENYVGSLPTRVC